MKKLIYIAFCMTVAMSLGCVALIYPNVTDNEGQGQFDVKTKSAHLEETAQTSQTVGSRRIEHVAFLDQKKGTKHKLKAWALELAVSTTNFHSDTFCNAKFANGVDKCRWLENKYAPPGPCSFTAPGVKLDLKCLGDFSAIGLCFSTRPGECGDKPGKGIPGADSLRLPFDKGELTSLLNAGVEDSRGILNFTVNAGNTQLVFDNGSQSFFPTIAGSYVIPVNMAKGFVDLDMSGLNHATNLRTFAKMLEDGGQSNWTYTVTYNGVTRSGQFAALDPAHYLMVADVNY